MHHFRLLIYFLSYTWSLKCGQLQDWKTWVGVYVKCYCFSIFVVVDRMFIINTNTVKHTHYVVIWIDFRCMWQESKKNKYLKESRWQTWALFECVFYKFAVPVVGCLTIAAGILARSNGVSKGTDTDQRFVKNALKNAELPPGFF